ncbi:AAA family ATPase [Cetobacterium somerae]
MYLEKIILENVGPLTKINISLKFDVSGNPKPLILVGENGCGKSFSVSSIVDSLYEFAKQSYSDVTNSSTNGTYYFKTLTSNSIRVGSNFYYSYLKFKNSNGDNIQYLEKTGSLSKEEFESKSGETFLGTDWTEANYKSTTNHKDFFEDEFYKNSYCFFPPFRYETPFWLNENSIGKEKFKLRERNNGILNKPILISNTLDENKSWFLDIIMDSRVDIIETEVGKYSAESSLADSSYLRKARENIETILSEIVRKKVKFKVNFRHNVNGRFSLINSESNDIFVNSLDALSTGQLALFNIFSTIVRYSDLADLHKGVKLNEISGIVIIEEIDLHQHNTILKEVLPKLIKLFPKVQFIITAHSPLFLLGMEEEFGEEGITIVELPNGNEITSERFKEFENSFNYYKDTKTYSDQIKNVLNDTLRTLTKPLVITEGKTDWKHFKAALKYYHSQNKFLSLDIQFLEYDNSLKMSESELETLLKHTSKFPQNKKIIGIFDSDSSIGKKHSIIKNYNNNTFGICIDIPSHRNMNIKGISVELLYLDTDLLKPDSSGRRLYLSNEFKANGRLKTDTDIAYENPKSIKENLEESTQKIIDTDISNGNEESLALSKESFSNYILNGTSPYDNMNFSGFESLFIKLESIINNN